MLKMLKTPQTLYRVVKIVYITESPWKEYQEMWENQIPYL